MRHVSFLFFYCLSWLFSSILPHLSSIDLLNVTYLYLDISYVINNLNFFYTNMPTVWWAIITYNNAIVSFFCWNTYFFHVFNEQVIILWYNCYFNWKHAQSKIKESENTFICKLKNSFIYNLTFLPIVKSFFLPLLHEVNFDCKQ